MVGLKEKLDCSRATVARIVKDMQDYFGAPIEYNRQLNGYYYNQLDGEHPFELTGLWFSADELHGLLIC